MFKVRAYVNHRPVGFLRRVDREQVLLSTRIADATKFGEGYLGAQEMGESMALLKRPERENSKKPEPTLTFELIKV